jgi:hypothetical protein
MFKHLKKKKLSYLKHFIFAMRVSWKLSLASTAFFIHALLPFIKIPYDLNLESMALYLFEKNNELED